MLKVLSIASYRFLPPKTGGQRCIAFFNRFFSKHVVLTCASVPENTKSNSDPYNIVPLLGSNTLRYINPLLFFRLRSFIRSQQITHVLLEHPYYGWLGWLLKQFAGIQLVIHAHNIEALRFRDIGKWWWKILWHYERFGFRQADILFFISEEDRRYATATYGIASHKSIVVPYGTIAHRAPRHEDKYKAKQVVANIHGFDEKNLLLLYSAALNYPPNLKGLDEILHQINPALQQSALRYTIIISGGGLPAAYNHLAQYADRCIVFAGFVEDIDLYFKAADIFLNPVDEGGGIKTKLVEALAANTNSVSYNNGAYGIPLSATGSKLQVVANSDAAAFSAAVVRSAAQLHENIPATFFNYFYWDNIAKKAADKLHEHHTSDPRGTVQDEK